MQGTRRAIHLAYSLTTRNGRIYHAKAYGEEYGFPGLPENHVFKSGAGIGNDSDSADKACKAALNALLADRPDLQGVPVFYFGRQSDESIRAAPAFSFRGRNWQCGIAGVES